MPPSLYSSALVQPLQLNGTETTVYVNAIKTATGETVTWTEFSPFTRGILVVDPEGVYNTPEIISFTGVDSVNIAFMGCVRGLSAVGSGAVSANKVYHGTNAPVIISWGAQNISDLISYLNTLVSGANGNASDTVRGITALTENLSVLPRAMAALASQQSSPNLTLKINPFSAFSTLTSSIINYAGGNTASMTAPSVNPRLDLVVYNITAAALAVRTGTEGVSPSEPTPTFDDIVICSVFHRVGETSVKENDDATNGYVKKWYSMPMLSVTPPGIISPYAGRTAPTGWLLCDGSAVSRTTYNNLFSVIAPSQSVTFTNSSTNVTVTSHNMVVGDKLHFTTTGTLPTNFTTNTDYYVKSVVNANTLVLALSPSGATITAGSAGSGSHTLYKSAWGKGDGSTTFSLPDFRGRSLLGLGSNGTLTVSFEGTAVNAGADTVAVPDATFPLQGQPITLTSTATLPAPLATSTTYYVIRNTSTTIKLATTQANANAGTQIDITDTGTAGAVHTITYSMTNRTVLGVGFGEEQHAINSSELVSHRHGLLPSAGGAYLDTVGPTAAGASAESYAVTTAGSGGNGTNTAALMQNTGGDTQHNNMPPVMQSNFIIKY